MLNIATDITVLVYFQISVARHNTKRNNRIVSSLFSSSCHEKATEALYIGRIQIRLEVDLVLKFSA